MRQVWSFRTKEKFDQYKIIAEPGPDFIDVMGEKIAGLHKILVEKEEEFILRNLPRIQLLQLRNTVDRILSDEEKGGGDE